MTETPLIKLVLFDVDGVLTDGTLHFDGNGEAVKSFNAKDGIAISLLRSHGIKVGVLSGRDSPALHRRCLELKFDIVLAGVQDKEPVFQNLLERLNVRPEEVAFVGDDVNDILVLNSVGHSYAPSDAHQMVLSTVGHICDSKGGAKRPTGG